LVPTLAGLPRPLPASRVANCRFGMPPRGGSEPGFSMLDQRSGGVGAGVARRFAPDSGAPAERSDTLDSQLSEPSRGLSLSEKLIFFDPHIGVPLMIRSTCA